LQQAQPFPIEARRLGRARRAHLRRQPAGWRSAPARQLERVEVAVHRGDAALQGSRDPRWREFLVVQPLDASPPAGALIDAPSASPSIAAAASIAPGVQVRGIYAPEAPVLLCEQLAALARRRDRAAAHLGRVRGLTAGHPAAVAAGKFICLDLVSCKAGVPAAETARRRRRCSAAGGAAARQRRKVDSQLAGVEEQGFSATMPPTLTHADLPCIHQGTQRPVPDPMRLRRLQQRQRFTAGGRLGDIPRRGLLYAGP
jgi:hypothetical protein